ncbi:MAG: nucleotidyltransferase domain-containing protein [Candidatus Pacearchaeota archaeon]|nr:nucleotidyltransferase domain-containing protein [Candidatus Pacearchaeota archaeon]
MPKKQIKKRIKKVNSISIILKEVIKQVEVPEETKKQIEETTMGFRKQVEPELRKIGAKLFIGGSLAKNTLIKKEKNYDVDVFVLFDYKKYKTKSNQISQILENVLKKKKINYQELKGSRNYFQIPFNNIIIEVVPILEIKNVKEALNITDISPLHVTYITKKEKKTKNNKLSDEIKLAKSFCYAHDCYGAESYVNGFSGYALEVLVSTYGSFLKFISASMKWSVNKKTIIDPERYYKSDKKILEEINESKKISPLILIDPVQKERNVTAALGQETLEKFIAACKSFFAKPSEKHFVKERIDVNSFYHQALKQKARFYIITVKSTKDKVDIAGAKLKKFYEFFIYSLKRAGFSIIKCNFDFDERTLDARFYFILKDPEKEYIIKGPPVNIDKKHTEAFKYKWQNVFIKDKRLYAKAKRELVSFEIFFNKFKNNDMIKEMSIESIKLEK